MHNIYSYHAKFTPEIPNKFIKKYSNKGDMVAISGRMQNRNYEDKEGNKRYSTEILVNKVTLLASRKVQNEYKDASIKTKDNALESLDVKIEPNDLPF